MSINIFKRYVTSPGLKDHPWFTLKSSRAGQKRPRFPHTFRAKWRSGGGGLGENTGGSSSGTTGGKTSAGERRCCKSGCGHLSKNNCVGRQTQGDSEKLSCHNKIIAILLTFLLRYVMFVLFCVGTVSSMPLGEQLHYGGMYSEESGHCTVYK